MFVFSVGSGQGWVDHGSGADLLRAVSYILLYSVFVFSVGSEPESVIDHRSI